MDTALLREHCFEVKERSHEYHALCSSQAAGKSTRPVCRPAPVEFADHFCHRAIDLYHNTLARLDACRALPLARAPVSGHLDRLSRRPDVRGTPPLALALLAASHCLYWLSYSDPS